MKWPLLTSEHWAIKQNCKAVYNYIYCKATHYAAIKISLGTGLVYLKNVLMLLQSAAFPAECNKCDGTILFIPGPDKESGPFTTWQATLTWCSSYMLLMWSVIRLCSLSLSDKCCWLSGLCVPAALGTALTGVGGQWFGNCESCKACVKWWCVLRHCSWLHAFTPCRRK